METNEELQSRHRKEQKDLQARISQKKKGATKKTRKGVNDECDEWERQLKERQEQERAEVVGETVNHPGTVSEYDEETPQAPAAMLNGITKSLDRTTISESTPSEDSQPKKRNRAKERLARRAAEQQAAVEDAKKEATNQPDKKEIERKKILEQATAEGLIEKLIRPDGHCLFSAVADQLSQAGIPLSADSDDTLKEDQRYKVVRKAAAGYIGSHPDEFMPWLDEPLDQYVEKIRDTAEWGGHLELLALAKTYNIEICVLQDGTQQTIIPALEGKKTLEKIWLAYYRHGFGLGEHYNSLRSPT